MKDEQNFLIRNLKDSGLNKEQIVEYLKLKTINDKNKFLEDHRKKL